MKIILDKIYRTNIMSAKIWIEDGSRNDPKDKKGIHQLLSSLMLRGCGPYNNSQLAEIIESSGSNLHCDTYEDGLLISLKCVESDAYKLLPIIGWMITKPLLQQNQIKLEKDLTIKAIKRQKESTYQLAFDCWRKMVYGDGPYGHDPLGSIDHINKINKKDILLIAKSLIYRKKSLVISGNFPVNIDSYLKNSNAFKGIIKNHNNQDKTYLYNSKLVDQYINKTDICTYSLNTKQVILLLGKSTICYDNKSDILLRLLSCYLGYGMTSLLFKVLREKYGVVYEAGVYHPIRENKTPFIMHASTTEDKAILTLQLLKECWGKIINSEISSDELDLLKIKYRGQVAHSLQSVSQRAEHKAHLLGMGLRKDHDEKILLNLDRITGKEIKDAANKYLENPLLSVCSNKEVIRKINKHWLSQKSVT